MRLLLILMIVASILFETPKALADSSCMPLYGGGQSCGTANLAITKNVVNPATNQDVHDLGTSDTQFAVGQQVTFHITVTNNGSSAVNGATVTDYFPQFLGFTTGPGNFSSSNGQLSFQIGNLNPGQSQTFTIMGTVVNTNGLLTQSRPTCVVNQATVSTSANQFASQDSSQFCIQALNGSSASIATPNVSTSSYTPPQVATSPATGSSDIALGLLLPVGLLGAGISAAAKKKGRLWN